MLFIAKVMACGFITFYSMPEAVQFLVRLTMMVVTQVVVGKTLQREEQRWSRYKPGGASVKHGGSVHGHPSPNG